MRVREKVLEYLVYKIIRSFLFFTPMWVKKKLASSNLKKYLRGEDIKIHLPVYGTKYIILADFTRTIDMQAVSELQKEQQFFYLIRNEKIKKLVREGVFVDVGANIGTMSLALLELRPKKVISVEPGPLYYELLNNIALNNLESKVSPINLGISNEKANFVWYEDVNNKGNAHLLSNEEKLDLTGQSTKLSDEGVDVIVETFDGVLKISGVGEHERISFIKIDVEGMEEKVVQSAFRIIQRDKPVLYIETSFNLCNMQRRDCFTRFVYSLLNIGYKTFYFDGNNFKETWYPNFKGDTVFVYSTGDADK